jgi:hypothetical protein
MIEIERTRLISALIVIILCTAGLSVMWTLAIQYVLENRRDRLSRKRAALRECVRENRAFQESLADVALSCNLICMTYSVYLRYNITGYRLWKVAHIRRHSLRKLQHRLESVGLSLGFEPAEADGNEVCQYISKHLDGILDGLELNCGTIRWDRPVILAPFPMAS